MADFYGGPEECHFDFKAHGSVSAAVDEGLYMLDIARNALFGVKCYLIIVLMRLDTIAVVIGMKGKLAGILVLLWRIGVMDFDGPLLGIDTVKITPIAPRSVTALHKLLFLALVPNRSGGLVKPHDIDAIPQATALGTENHGISFIENAARLRLVGRHGCAGRKADR